MRFASYLLGSRARANPLVLSCSCSLLLSAQLLLFSWLFLVSSVARIQLHCVLI